MVLCAYTDPSYRAITHDGPILGARRFLILKVRYFILARGLLAFLGLQDSLPGQSRRGELVLVLLDVQIPQIPGCVVNLTVKLD